MSTSPDALALLSGSSSPLASSLPGMLLPDAATVQAAVQAAAMQHQLSMMQVRCARCRPAFLACHGACCAALPSCCSARADPACRPKLVGPRCRFPDPACRPHIRRSRLQADTTSLLTAASADPASLLAAATGVRQPLLPLSLNLGHQHYHHAPPAAAPSCYSLGL